MKKTAATILSLSLLTGISMPASAQEVDTKPTVDTNLPNEIYESEPNNYRETANPFVIGQQIKGDYVEDSRYPTDYYVFTAPKSGEVRFSLNNNNLYGAPLSLFDENNRRLSTNSIAIKSFVVEVEQGKKYYLKTDLVTGQGSKNVSYHIDTAYLR